ncbi:MAG TPA: hydrogenase maturation nickel metallochaperone HypA [Bacteroidales bacterium]|nr:hydrogenase maturation nickel metallochaperone HypA [Bacteroidales bacterium]HRC88945.1 hydrogenase maturation nickel metallochaperone HypA [Bacteroidales bacterium]
MHELSIAENLSEIVIEVAEKEKLSKVTRVNVSFGKMVQIIPEFFEKAFRAAVSGTIANDAEINIEEVPVTIRCNNCNFEMTLDEYNFVCERCGSSDIDIVTGRELYVKSIEGE